MHSEVVLMYSYTAFGTSDAISFRDNLLRIHELKTGLGKPSFNQLNIYAALFCLEYHIEPRNIEIELRIYQGIDIAIEDPNREDILFVMDSIRISDKLIDQIDKEV